MGVSVAGEIRESRLKAWSTFKGAGVSTVAPLPIEYCSVAVSVKGEMVVIFQRGIPSVCISFTKSLRASAPSVIALAVGVAPCPIAPQIRKALVMI
jgi:hypothetical protein